jgi:hypothetical protein
VALSIYVSLTRDPTSAVQVSLLPAVCLGLQPTHWVLDMCALRPILSTSLAQGSALLCTGAPRLARRRCNAWT